MSSGWPGGGGHVHSKALCAVGLQRIQDNQAHGRRWVTSYVPSKYELSGSVKHMTYGDWSCSLPRAAVEQSVFLLVGKLGSM